MVRFLLIFLLTGLLGMFATWVDRKVSARLQYRQGPPWFQPWADFVKLLGKETIVPEGAAPLVFLGAPLLGLAGTALVAAMLFTPGVGFVGDLIVMIYLLLLPSLAIMLGGSAARNPLAAVGASREMKLILSYELPFLIAVLTVVLKSGSIFLHAAHSVAPSTLLALVAALLVVQAKLGAVPFDIAEADQELAAGALIEYSGPPLAVFRLTRAMLYFVLPSFLVILFLGGLDAWFPLKYLIILTSIILIKNTNPRLRADQAVRFFWGPVTVLAIVGFILALIGY